MIGDAQTNRPRTAPPRLPTPILFDSSATSKHFTPPAPPFCGRLSLRGCLGIGGRGGGRLGGFSRLSKGLQFSAQVFTLSLCLFPLSAFLFKRLHRLASFILERRLCSFG